MTARRDRASLHRSSARTDAWKTGGSKGILRGIVYLAVAVGIGLAFGLCVRGTGAAGGQGGASTSGGVEPGVGPP